MGTWFPSLLPVPLANYASHPGSYLLRFLRCHRTAFWVSPTLGTEVPCGEASASSLPGTLCPGPSDGVEFPEGRPLCARACSLCLAHLSSLEYLANTIHRHRGLTATLYWTHDSVVWHLGLAQLGGSVPGGARSRACHASAG